MHARRSVRMALLAAVLFTWFAGALLACQSREGRGPFEEAGSRLDHAARSTGSAITTTTDRAVTGAGSAGRSAGSAARSAGSAVSDTANRAVGHGSDGG